MANNDVAVIILTKNSSAVLPRALASVEWADAVVVVDDESSDNSVDIARKSGAVIVQKHYEGFAAKRNAGRSATNAAWLFYLDADEVVSNSLALEIQRIVTANKPGVWRVVRDNYFLGTKMYPDSMERLFHQESLVEWQGNLHEHPVVRGDIAVLSNHLAHYTHSDISSMLDKTNEWSEIEAQLRIDAHHPPMSWWRLPRIALTVWWQQLFGRGVWRYGRAGWFEGYFQMIDKLIVYTKLWEKQHHARRRI